MRHGHRSLNLRLGLMVGLLAFGALLTGCGQSQPAVDPSADAASSTDTDGAASAAEGDLSRAAQLALGTLKLEETSLAVTRDQGSQLAFLWQAYGSLLRSDTAAAQELQALVNQIEGALSAEQLQAIRDMELTREALTAWVQENGIGREAAEGAYGRQGFTGYGPSQGMPGAAPGAGGGEGGGPPAGSAPAAGGMMMGPAGGEGAGATGGAEGLSTEMQATLQAQRPAAGAVDRVVLMLLDPLIDLLKERAGA